MNSLHDNFRRPLQKAQLKSTYERERWPEVALQIQGLPKIPQGYQRYLKLAEAGTFNNYSISKRSI